MSELTPDEIDVIAAEVWDAYRIGRAMPVKHEDIWHALAAKPYVVETDQIVEKVNAIIAARVEAARADERERCRALIGSRVPNGTFLGGDA